MGHLKGKSVPTVGPFRLCPGRDGVRVVHVILTIFTIMLILYAHKMLLLCSKSPTIMLKIFPQSLIFYLK